MKKKMVIQLTPPADIPPVLLEEVILGMVDILVGDGSEKYYGDWVEREDIVDLSAALRHTFQGNDEIDIDSGYPHSFHAATRMMLIAMRSVK